MALTGIMVPLVTPFAVDGSVALDALAELAVRVLADGAAGLVALGTTGEPSSLTDDERLDVLRVVSSVCCDRGAPLLVGASTPEALSALDGNTAVTAALTSVPAFVRPGEAGAEAHLRSLAEHSPVPLAVYHVPQRTGQELSAATMLRLAAVPGIVGVKWATGRVDAEAVALLGSAPSSLAVLAGDDGVLSPMLALGARGGIVASAHLATAGFVELAEAWAAGDLVRARGLGHRLAALSAALFAEPNPTVIKALLHAQGRIPTAGVRLPLLPAAQSSLETALAALAALWPAGQVR